jgi:hypothetical protein
MFDATLILFDADTVNEHVCVPALLFQVHNAVRKHDPNNVEIRPLPFTLKPLPTCTTP